MFGEKLIEAGRTQLLGNVPKVGAWRYGLLISFSFFIIKIRIPRQIIAMSCVSDEIHVLLPL